MRIMISSALALAVLAAFSAVGSVVANGGSNGLGYSATPLGVIILTARGGMDMGRGGSVGPYFADANGMTLYTFDKDPTGQ